MIELAETRWEAVTGRDSAMDGVFVYAVTTTGIYCRPGCTAKRPNRENVRFFATADDAAAHDFRACLRCRPDAPRAADPQVATVLSVCRWLEHPDEEHDSGVLAGRVGWDKRYLQREFRKVVGLSMKSYERGLQAERARTKLRSGQSVTEAIYEAGYGSSRAFYDHGARRLGMKPSDYASGGSGHQIAYTVVSTVIGEVLVATTEVGVCAVKIGDDKAPLIQDLHQEFRGASLTEGAEDLAYLARTVAAMAEGAPSDQLPTDIQGTAFQLAVWDALRQIPCGTVKSYAEVAAAIGHPTAARAVANACAANAVALVIPCHRVVRADGTSGGYRWGPGRKEALLLNERQRADDEAEMRHITPPSDRTATGRE